LYIPPRHRPVLERLFLLGHDQLAQLRNALAGAGLSIPPERIANEVGYQVPTLPADELAAVVDVLISLYGVREALELSIDDFVDALIASVQETSPNIASARPMPELVDEVRALLDVETLKVESRALDLLYEHSRVFQSARILTDIRPVFSEDVHIEPKNAVVTHMLKIVYRQEDDLHELFVSMDSKDLETLAAVLTRAREKERSVWSLLDRAGVAHPSTEVDGARPTPGS
jgi:hypothetical protein